MHVPSRVPSRSLFFSAALSGLFMLTLFCAHAHAQDVTVRGTDDPRAAKKQADERQRPLPERVADGELPPSRLSAHIKPAAAATHRLPPISEEALKNNDQSQFEKRTPVGVVRDLPRPVERTSDATFFATSENTNTGVLKIVAEGAREIRVRLTDFDLPAGARLYVYSAQNPEEVYGPYEGRGANGDGEFWTPPFAGEGIIVEYVAPAASPATPADGDHLPFRVAQVNHIFRDTRTSEFAEKAAGTCNQSIPEEWRNIARSVGLISFISGGYSYVCTGTLLNSRNNDLTPYFLTANHCISIETEARSSNIRWFYDGPNAAYYSSSGASLLSTSSSSDYSLLMIHGALPTGVRWAGWTTTGVAIGTPVTGVHHPAGDYKRISFGELIDAPCPTGMPGACDNFYKVRWNSGTTEGGSSGSGIWTGAASDPLLIGTLNGGFASCSNLSGTDFYGRFDRTYPAIASLLEGGSDDSLEDNDTREAARLLTSGADLRSLVVKSTDEDWYRVRVPAGAMLEARFNYSGSNGGIAAQFYRASGSEPLDASSEFSSVPNLRLRHTNNTGEDADYFVRVLVTNDTRANYDMNLVVQTCSFTLSRTNVTIPRGSSQAYIEVRGTVGCVWTTSSNVGWASVSPTARAASFTFDPAYVNVPYYEGRTPRTGTVTIAGQTVTVTQEGITCAYTTTPTTRSFGQSGGTGVTDVTYNDRVCGDWTATSNADWINITSTTPNYTNTNAGQLRYSVQPNTAAAARTGTLVVAANTITVTQAGADPQWQRTTLRADQVQFKSWQQIGRHAQAYVKLTFPSSGYRVADWGQVVRVGNDRSVDIVIERHTGASLPVETTTANIYEMRDFPQSGVPFTVRLGEGVTVAGVVRTFSYVLNPIDEAGRFATEQYRDFLGREPDAPGLNYWTGQITLCGANAACLDRQREGVSASFFLSQEFQATGYYVYRLYRAGLGRVPYYSEFVPDAAQVGSGIVVNNRLSPGVINSNKQAFARSFVGRQQFRARFDGKSSAETVDLLFQATGVQPAAGERQALIDELDAGAGTQDERRASVLYKIADGIRAAPPADGGVGVDQVFETRYGRSFYDAEYNRAFVLMEYFGYLKRDPDEDGYRYWLDKLNLYGNYRDAEMVKAFIVSAEYRSRFGQP